MPPHVQFLSAHVHTAGHHVPLPCLASEASSDPRPSSSHCRILQNSSKHTEPSWSRSARAKRAATSSCDQRASERGSQIPHVCDRPKHPNDTLEGFVYLHEKNTIKKGGEVKYVRKVCSLPLDLTEIPAKDCAYFQSSLNSNSRRMTLGGTCLV